MSRPGGDDERLGDGGVVDGVGVATRCRGREVDAGGVGERGEVVGERGLGEPGGEESGGLGALSGADDDNHVS